MKRSNSTILHDNEGSKIEITPLGAGNEVGRSCILLTYKDKSILLDCGIHPAYTGMGSLPFFDRCNLGKIDLLLVSQYVLYNCVFRFTPHPILQLASIWIMPQHCPISYIKPHSLERYI